MARRLSLRSRVALACAGLGLLLSLLFAAAAWVVAENYEEFVADALLETQARDYVERLRYEPGLALPRTPGLRGYRRDAAGSDIPPELAALPPGTHEIEGHAAGEHALVIDDAQGRLVFVIHLGVIETREQYLVLFSLVVVLAGTALSAWLGWLLAARAIRPVRRLAEAVEALPVRAVATRLAADGGSDEVGRLAQSIDAYQARLVEADAAERAFFADASHELRTPISVVLGVTEVLLDEPAEPARLRRLQRLERGVLELADLAHMLFGLARRSAYVAEPVELAGLLQDCAALLRASAGTAALAVEVQAEGRANLPQAEFLMLLRALLRRLLPAVAAGRLQLRARDGEIHLEYFPVMENASGATLATSPRSDRSLGLTLLGRFAAHLGWQVEESTDQDAPRRITLSARPAG
jgi:HAMP domain-containing protein